MIAIYGCIRQGGYAGVFSASSPNPVDAFCCVPFLCLGVLRCSHISPNVKSIFHCDEI